jgi:uncharacterized lipoprotein YehR (DUF1307 family)
MKVLTKTSRHLVLFSFIIILLSSCIDDTIEGAAGSTAPVTFKANTASLTYASLNTCVYSTTPNGTRFNLTIDYQGKQGDPVYKIEYTY